MGQQKISFILLTVFGIIGFSNGGFSFSTCECGPEYVCCYFKNWGISGWVPGRINNREQSCQKYRATSSSSECSIDSDVIEWSNGKPIEPTQPNQPLTQLCPNLIQNLKQCR